MYPAGLICYKILFIFGLQIVFLTTKKNKFHYNYNAQIAYVQIITN
jgi:hypothetical protein